MSLVGELSAPLVTEHREGLLELYSDDPLVFGGSSGGTGAIIALELSTGCPLLKSLNE